MSSCCSCLVGWRRERRDGVARADDAAPKASSCERVLESLELLDREELSAGAISSSWSRVSGCLCWFVEDWAGAAVASVVLGSAAASSVALRTLNVIPFVLAILDSLRRQWVMGW